jgi:hypothetical protein
LQFDLVATQLSYASSMDWEWKDRLGDLAGCGAVVDGLAACCCNSRIMLMLDLDPFVVPTQIATCEVVVRIIECSLHLHLELIQHLLSLCIRSSSLGRSVQLDLDLRPTPQIDCLSHAALQIMIVWICHNAAQHALPVFMIYTASEQSGSKNSSL